MGERQAEGRHFEPRHSRSTPTTHDNDATILQKGAVGDIIRVERSAARRRPFRDATAPAIGRARSSKHQLGDERIELLLDDWVEGDLDEAILEGAG